MAGDPKNLKRGNAFGEKVRKRLMLDSGLSPEQEAYCRARAMGMSLIEARSAAELKQTIGTIKKWESHNPKIAKRVQELSDIASKNAIIATGLDREWVIKRLMQVVDRSLQNEPVMAKVGKEWVPTGEYKFDAAGANGALKMLGDTMGLFRQAEKKPEDDYATLSDDELARITAELASQLGLLETPAGAKAPPRHQEDIEVQAIPATGGVSQRGEDVPGEVVPGWQPVGENVVERVRDRFSCDGSIPELVEWKEVEPTGDGVGIGRVDGIDPGHDAAVGDGAPGGVGDRHDPSSVDTGH